MNRMTRQSRENIKVAIEARVYQMTGGHTVELVGGEGRRAWVNGTEGVIRYPTIELARRAVRRINPAINLVVMPEI